MLRAAQRQDDQPASLTPASAVEVVPHPAKSPETRPEMVHGIVAMARAMGKTGTVKGPGPDVEWIAQQLRAGKLVVANGDYHAMPPHQNEARTSGHYVTVAGLDAQGNLIVRDPADRNVKAVTPAQLRHFIRSNPNGGWAISIG